VILHIAFCKLFDFMVSFHESLTYAPIKSTLETSGLEGDGMCFSISESSIVSLPNLSTEHAERSL